jgi:sulfur dioxygenase
MNMNPNITIKQFFDDECSAFTYIVYDSQTKDAVIIDPVNRQVERDLKFITENNLSLKLILDTHIHADHVTSSGVIKERTETKIGHNNFIPVKNADIPLHDGEMYQAGTINIKVIHTPGHTNSCMSYLIENNVFTGDALMINGCGRTDFQEGDSHKLFHSVREKLFALPDETNVYPAHDYKGFTSSTIGNEKKGNARLNLSLSEDQFVEIMNNLKLTPPAKLEESVKGNLVCGKI